MGSIMKRTEVSYTLIAELGYDAKGKRIRKTKTIRIEDKKLLKAPTKLQRFLDEQLLIHETEVRNGEYIDPSKSSFSDFVDIWRVRHAPKALSPKTYSVFNGYLENHILPYLGDKKLTSINTVQLVAFFDKKINEKSERYNKQLSPSTVKYFHRILRHLFKLAKEWNLIKVDPMLGVKAPKVEKREMEYYSSDDMPDVMKIINDLEPMWSLYFTLAIFAGTRRGETVALQWKHHDPTAGTINIEENMVLGLNEEGKEVTIIKEPKSKASKAEIILPDFVNNMLINYRRAWIKEKFEAGDLWEHNERDFIFHNGFGRPLRPDTPSKKWRKIRSKHEIKKTRLHDLRHTMVALLMDEDNVNELAISKQARHASARFTSDVYGHISKKRQKSTINKLEKYGSS
jgi:integrase